MRNYRLITRTKSREEWKYLILQWVHNEIDRQMLELFLLDEKSIGEISEIVDLSTVQVQKRIARARVDLFEHI